MDEKEFIEKAIEYLQENHVNCDTDTIKVTQDFYQQPLICPTNNPLSKYSLHEIARSLAKLTNKKIEYKND